MNTLKAKSRNRNPASLDLDGFSDSGVGKISLVIPAFNEEDVIATTLLRLPPGIFAKVLVADNGSSDKTAEVARAAGAQVVHTPRRGYGSACLAALAECADDEVLVFLQADGSEDAAEADALTAPIFAGKADLVIGSRTLGKANTPFLRPHQRFGNWLATELLARFWGFRYSDLGPFRAIRASDLRRLGMRELQYGWTIEMQLRALEEGLRVCEIPVHYGPRLAGVEKVSGNWKASLQAGFTILSVIFRSALRRSVRRGA